MKLKYKKIIPNPLNLGFGIIKTDEFTCENETDMIKYALKQGHIEHIETIPELPETIRTKKKPTYEELKDLAKSKGIEFTGNIKRVDLEELIKNHVE
jgi:hypothetical protein